MKNQTTTSAPKNFLPKNIRTAFHYTTTEEEQVGNQMSVSIQEQLDVARLREIKSKFVTRIVLTVLFILLLFVQNVIVFYVVYESLILNRLASLQLIFSTLIAATLTETYFVIKIIVNYMFRDEDYTYKNPLN